MLLELGAMDERLVTRGCSDLTEGLESRRTRGELRWGGHCAGFLGIYYIQLYRVHKTKGTGGKIQSKEGTRPNQSSRGGGDRKYQKWVSTHPNSGTKQSESLVCREGEASVGMMLSTWRDQRHGPRGGAPTERRVGRQVGPVRRFGTTSELKSRGDITEAGRLGGGG